MFLEGSRKGQNVAFMEAVKIAKGEIISCLDADDWYYENMLAYKMELHKKYPSCVMVDSSLSVDGVSRMVDARTDFDYAEALRKYGYIYAHNNTSGLSIQKEYLNFFLPFSDAEEMKAGLDCILVHIALSKSNIIVDKRICGGHREHDDNVYSERKLNLNGGYPEYIKKLKQYARKQAARGGVVIPDSDAEWYKNIINQVLAKIHQKRIVVYGTSEIGKSVIRRLEELNETIGEISLEKFIGRCIVIDMESCLQKGMKKILLKGDFELSLEAAKIIIENGVDLVGVENCTVGNSRTGPVIHEILLEKEVVILEGLVLRPIEEGEYFLLAQPVNLGQVDGAPCRAVLLEDSLRNL